jgi:hypothetical protein
LVLVGILLSVSGMVPAVSVSIQTVAAQQPVDKDFDPPSYRGIVVGLTEKTVTIKPAGILTCLEISSLPDGTKKERQYTQDNTQPPREFVFSEILRPRPGGVGRPIVGHQIADLRMGDVVEISCQRSRGVYVCTDIKIHRRPGGRVPPTVADARLSQERRWDNARNAEQDREEKATAALQRFTARLFR